MRRAIAISLLILVVVIVSGCARTRTTHIVDSARNAKNEQNSMTVALSERGQDDLAERSAKQAKRLADLEDQCRTLSALLWSIMFGDNPNQPMPSYKDD